MGDWVPDKTETFTAKDGDEYTILLWTIPEKRKKESAAPRPQPAERVSWLGGYWAAVRAREGG